MCYLSLLSNIKPSILCVGFPRVDSGPESRALQRLIGIWCTLYDIHASLDQLGSCFIWAMTYPSSTSQSGPTSFILAHSREDVEAEHVMTYFVELFHVSLKASLAWMLNAPNQHYSWCYAKPGPRLFSSSNNTILRSLKPGVSMSGG